MDSATAGPAPIEIGIDTFGDVTLDDRGQLDFKGSYDFTQHWSAYVELLNLTDEPLRFFSGKDSGRLAENEIYGWNAIAGVRVRF